MKIKEGFLVREVAGQPVAVPVGGKNPFRGMIQLNVSGLMLWELLREERTEAELVDRLLDRYDTDRATAEADVSRFLQNLRTAGILSE